MKFFYSVLITISTVIVFILLLKHAENTILAQNTVYPVQQKIYDQKKLHDSICPKEFYTVLSVDGGGSRGLIPLNYLQSLEEYNHKGTASIFNLMGGVSTGAVIISSLSRVTKEEDISFRYSAKQISDFYKNNINDFFETNFTHNLLSLYGLLLPLINPNNKNTFLKNHFKNITLDSLYNQVVIFAFGIKDKKILLFCNWTGCNNKLKQYSIGDIVSGATSITGLFPPVILASKNNKNESAVSDLSLMNNNPAYMTYRLAKKICPSVKHYVVLSLGTGKYPDMGNTINAYHWGILQWLPNIIAASTAVNSAVTDEYLAYMMSNELNTLLSNDQLPELIYIRFNPKIDWEQSNPLTTSASNLDYFIDVARKNIKKHSVLLKCIANIREKDSLTQTCKTQISQYIRIERNPYFSDSLPGLLQNK